MACSKLGQMVSLQYLSVGAPIAVLPPPRKQVARETHVMIGAFVTFDADDSLYLLTHNSCREEGEVKLLVLDTTSPKFVMRATGPVLGRQWFSYGEVTLIEMAPVIREFRSPHRKQEHGWQYFTDLEGTDCHVHISDDVFRDACENTPVQTMQMGGYRYGTVDEYDLRTDTLFVNGVTPGVPFSDDDGKGALVTSLTQHGEVTAYGIVAGTDFYKRTRVVPIGPALEVISMANFGGKRLRICSPRLREI